ncbi:MAG: hypothetical protein JST48_10435 [Bacteroidetes bacterium]|nr:hypothetical protein [Bacteroidota bacterium]
MRKIKKLIFFAILLLAVKGYSQKLYLYKTFGGVVYMLNDSVQLSTRQTASLLYQNQQAYAEFKKARKLSTYSAIAGFTGAAMIAVPVATVAFGERADWGLSGGGAALIIGSIFLNRAFKAKTLDAVDVYNEGLVQKTSRIKPEFYFYGTGAKFTLKF